MRSAGVLGQQKPFLINTVDRNKAGNVATVLEAISLLRPD